MLLEQHDTALRGNVGFAVGVTTASRYVQEARALLALVANDLTTATDQIRRLAYAILDDTLIPIDRSPIRSRTTPGNTSPTA